MGGVLAWVVLPHACRAIALLLLLLACAPEQAPAEAKAAVRVREATPPEPPKPEPPKPETTTAVEPKPEPPKPEPTTTVDPPVPVSTTAEPPSPDAASTLTVDLAGYSRACKRDRDCALVRSNPCSRCGCENEPIAKSEHPRFLEERRAIECPPPEPMLDGAGCGGCPGYRARCEKGTCVTGP